jgi:hypothetical protein
MNVDFGFLMWSLLGANARFQAHIANQQSSINNHQSSSRFARSEAPPR